MPCRCETRRYESEGRVRGYYHLRIMHPTRCENFVRFKPLALMDEGGIASETEAIANRNESGRVSAHENHAWVSRFLEALFARCNDMREHRPFFAEWRVRRQGLHRSSSSGRHTVHRQAAR